MSVSVSRFFMGNPAAITSKVETDFFSALKLSNDTFKKTGIARFAAVNREWTEHLKQTRRSIGTLLDVGISSGTTTLELVADLAEAGFRPRVTATDLLLDGYIVELGRGMRALVDPKGFVLLYEILGRTFRPWRRRLDCLDGMVVLRSLMARTLAPRARLALAQGRIVKHVQLTSPRLLHYPEVEILRDDILVENTALKRRFDLVRAANILNRGYFEETALRAAAGNLKNYLAPGGELLVIRTLGRDQQHGTLFRNTGNGMLEVVRRFGQGSEIEALLVERAA